MTTAEEFFIQKMFPNGNITKEDAQLWARTNESVQKSIEIAIEFAKLHVKAALEAAAKKAEIEENINGCRECGAWGVDEQSITDAYPETLIK